MDTKSFLTTAQPLLDKLPFRAGVTEHGSVAWLGMEKVWGLQPKVGLAETWKYNFPLHVEGDTLRLRPLCGLRHHPGGQIIFPLTASTQATDIVRACANICLWEDTSAYLLQSGYSLSNSTNDISQEWAHSARWERLCFSAYPHLSADISSVEVTIRTGILGPGATDKVPTDQDAIIITTHQSTTWPDMSGLEGAIVDGRQAAGAFYEKCLATATQIAGMLKSRFPDTELIAGHPYRPLADCPRPWRLHVIGPDPIVSFDTSALVQGKGPLTPTTTNPTPLTREIMDVLSSFTLLNLTQQPQPDTMVVELDLQ